MDGDSLYWEWAHSEDSPNVARSAHMLSFTMSSIYLASPTTSYPSAHWTIRDITPTKETECASSETSAATSSSLPERRGRVEPTLPPSLSTPQPQQLHPLHST